MDPDLISWPVVGTVVALIGGLGAVVGWVLREFAKRDKDIVSARATADRDIALLKDGFAVLRVHIAESYATKAGVSDSLKSVHDAIERLTDRIEKLTDRLMANPPA